MRQIRWVNTCSDGGSSRFYTDISGGKYKPDILIDDKTFKAQQKRSQIVGNNINQPDGARLSMAELMKLKNQNPDMDITPYLQRGKGK